MPQRLRRRPPQDLNDSERALYDEIAGGRRAVGRQAFSLTDEAGALVGPFNAMLLSPMVGQAMQAFGAVVRYETDLPERVREMVILAAAYENGCLFEQWAHETIARDIGISDQEIEELRRGGVPDSLDAGGRSCLTTAVLLAKAGRLNDEEYAAAVSTIGERGLFELSTIVGYYALLALQMRVFGVVPPGREAARSD